MRSAGEMIASTGGYTSNVLFMVTWSLLEPIGAYWSLLEPIKHKDQARAINVLSRQGLGVYVKDPEPPCPIEHHQLIRFLDQKSKAIVLGLDVRRRWM